MLEPTVKQQAVLDVIADYSEGATVRQVADRMERPASGSARYSYGEVRSLLEALRSKGYVSKRRVSGKRARNVYSLVPGT